LWSWYYQKLIKKIDHYILRNYSWILIGLWIYDHERFTLIFGLHDTDIICTTLHLSDITCTTLYLFLPLSILFHDLDTYCNHYLTLIFLTPFLDHAQWVTHYLALTLINEINLAEITGGDWSRRIQRGVLGRATLCGFGCHTWSCYLCAPVITCYKIHECSELFFPAIRIH